MKILLAGAAGRLGGRLVQTLGARHDLVLADVTRLDDPRSVQVDITDLPKVRAAVEACDAVVHMVIMDWPPCSVEESLRYGVPSLQVHVIGLYNVLQAAWEAGVRRVVYTSSISAVDGLPPTARIDSDTRHCSYALYGMGKGFGEDLCRMFHHAFGVSVAILRLGTLFIPEGRGAWVGNRFAPDLSALKTLGPLASLVHVDDVTRGIALALEGPDPGYALVHLVGPGAGVKWDLAAARRVYGWEPRYGFGEDGLAQELETARAV